MLFLPGDMIGGVSLAAGSFITLIAATPTNWQVHSNYNTHTKQTKVAL